MPPGETASAGGTTPRRTAGPPVRPGITPGHSTITPSIDVFESILDVISSLRGMGYRQRVESGSPYEQTIGFSRAVRAGSYVAVSGTAPIWPDGSVDPDPLAQARRCWDIALAALAELGGSVRHVVRTRTFITDRAVEASASRAHGERFASAAGPTLAA